MITQTRPIGTGKLVGKLANIQALRFLAALWVVGYHINGHYQFCGGKGLFDIFQYGWVGVDVFFVISGFVMWHTTRDKRGISEATTFLYRRFARIYLGYWPWLFATVLILWVFAPKILATYDLASAITLFRQPSKTNIFVINWSLSFELFFYFAFSILVLFPKRYSIPGLLLSALTIIISHIHGTSPKTFIFSLMILEFISGALLAATVDKFGAMWPWIGVCVAIAFAIAGIDFGPSARLPRVMTFGVASVGLVYAAVAYEMTGRTAKGIWVSLGDASYCLYLIQIPALLLIRWTIRDSLSAAPGLAYGSLLFILIAVSLWWHRIVEMPAYRLATSLPTIITKAVLRLRRSLQAAWLYRHQ